MDIFRVLCCLKMVAVKPMIKASIKFPGQSGDLSQRPPALTADFIISAAAAHQFPPELDTEIAILGRSNSGKSSLLNRWLGRRGLARVGATPGRTRLVNFFNIVWHKNETPFYLADLPGYGYAAAPKTMVANWRQLVANYLESRRPIKIALLLMDIRRNPTADEHGLLGWLKGLKIPVQLILTKVDKLGTGEQSRRISLIKKSFEAVNPLDYQPLLFSSSTGQGRDKLIETLIDSGMLTGDEPQ